METHQKNDELIDNVTPDGECEDQLESWGLAVTAHEAGDYWFRTEWSNKRIDQWLREIFPRVFCWLDTRYGVPKEPERHWHLLKSYRNRLKKDHATPSGLDLNHMKGTPGKPWSESKLYIG